MQATAELRMVSSHFLAMFRPQLHHPFTERRIAARGQQSETDLP